MESLKFIQFGVGPIGGKITKYLLERKNLELEAAIDNDPEKQGKDVSSFALTDTPLGITISDKAEKILAESKAKVVILSTLSSFSKLEKQINLCLKYKKKYHLILRRNGVPMGRTA